jgi:hypothetical protein
MSNYALRIPDSLFDYAKQCAEEENVSMNQFFVMAIAEKVSALKTAEFFRQQAKLADVKRARAILRKVPDGRVDKQDEIAAETREPRAGYRARRSKATKATSKGRKRSG